MSSGARGGRTRSRWPRRTARSSAAHSTSSSRVVGYRRPFGHRAARVAGAADALEQRRDAARRAELADQLDRPDVDAELERGRRDQHAQIARAQALLDAQPPLLREAAVVRGDLALAEPLLEQVRHALGEPARVRRRPAWCGASRPARRCRRGSRPTARPRPPPRARCRAPRSRGRARGDGRRRRSRRRAAPCASERPGPRADQQARHRLDRALRRGEADARRAAPRRARRGARARARGASRACRGRRRGSRRRSRCARGAASRGCARP